MKLEKMAIRRDEFLEFLLKDGAIHQYFFHPGNVKRMTCLAVGELEMEPSGNQSNLLVGAIPAAHFLAN
jgi:hypothetical protein